LVDEHGVPVAAGSEGVIEAYGPQLCVGYLDPALNDAFTADGFFRSGDLAVQDREGFIRITGRRKDIIIRKGENISAKEVENVLAEHPAVYQASVIGLPDATRGERVCAVIVPKTGIPLDKDKLAEWLKMQGIARQKIPEQIEIIDALPLTATGKVRKSELRARYSNACA
jgi:cyclohexanecarboxylate-CoA ligase